MQSVIKEEIDLGEYTRLDCLTDTEETNEGNFGNLASGHASSRFFKNSDESKSSPVYNDPVEIYRDRVESPKFFKRFDETSAKRRASNDTSYDSYEITYDENETISKTVKVPRFDFFPNNLNKFLGDSCSVTPESTPNLPGNKYTTVWNFDRLLKFKYIRLLTETKRILGDFGTIERRTTFALEPPLPKVNVNEQFKKAFEEIVDYAIYFEKDAANYVGLSLNSDNYFPNSIKSTFREAKKLSRSDMWKLANSTVRKAGKIIFRETFYLRVYNVTVPRGRGRINFEKRDVRIDSKAKRSVVSIDNSDNLCLPRSLALAKIFNDRGTDRSGDLHKLWNNARHHRSHRQRRLALELCDDAGVRVPEAGCGYEEIELFQRYFAPSNTAIVIYNASTFARGGKPMYDGVSRLASINREYESRLNVIYHDDSRHYDTVVNLRALSGYRNYCLRCNIGYTNDESGHRCHRKCEKCFSSPPCVDLKASNKCENFPMINCSECNRAFFTRDCFQRHKRNVASLNDGISSSNICDTLKFCKICRRNYKPNDKLEAERHRCDLQKCEFCLLPKETLDHHVCSLRDLGEIAKNFAENKWKQHDVQIPIKIVDQRSWIKLLTDENVEIVDIDTNDDTVSCHVKELYVYWQFRE